MFTVEMTVENVGNGPGAFESQVSVLHPTAGWVKSGDAEVEEIESGETGTWVSNEVTLETTGEYRFRIDELEEEFIIEAVPPVIQLEYTISAGKMPEELPEDIRKRRSDGGQREEGYKWVIVEFDVIEGALNMQDIWFRSRVETSTRFYDLDHATGDLVDGVQSRGDIKQGGSGIALYQIPADTDTYAWNLEQTQQNIEANLR